MVDGYVKDNSVYYRIGNNFSYHKPIGTQTERYELIRAKGKELAELLNAYCPESR